MTGIQLKCGALGCGYVTEEVTMDIAWGLVQFHRHDNHAQQGCWVGGIYPPRQAAAGKSSSKPDRLGLDMDMSEGGHLRSAWPGIRG